MGGTLWQYRDRYIDNSPVFDLNHVETPLLIVHGARDESVPVHFADEIYVDLRRLNQEVEYRKYTEEAHGIFGAADTMDYWTATLRWFDTHLKNK
jgi:dipeptidyl aminopeptidase/acylaminoacyl peptidase